uniref:Uncharacterized protein n=1 Tax=Cannabis sativa TaxID=3483 RepID=A0A803PI53_CANSA
MEDPNTTPAQQRDNSVRTTISEASRQNPAAPSIPNSTESQISDNSEYENLFVHDQLLMGWLYGSMTEGIASEVMGCQSASGLWSTLEKLYGAHCRDHMDELITKLQTVRKGSASMADYLKQKRMCADSLALNTLHSFDTRLERLTGLSNSNKMKNTLGALSANYAQKPTHNNTPHFSNTNRHDGKGKSPHSRARGRGGYHGRGRGGRFGGGSKLTRQVCGKYGHSTTISYNHYDDCYMGQQPATTSDQVKEKQFNALIATP